MWGGFLDCLRSLPCLSLTNFHSLVHFLRAHTHRTLWWAKQAAVRRLPVCPKRQRTPKESNSRKRQPLQILKCPTSPQVSKCLYREGHISSECLHNDEHTHSGFTLYNIEVFDHISALSTFFVCHKKGSNAAKTNQVVILQLNQ
jgi:hypothetical protein